jgi:multicomponent Na+:H+ antiporter subunit E
MLRAISSVATLFLFWVALSGFFTPFLLGAGLLSAIAVVWLAHRMAVVDKEGHPIDLGPAASRYWPWLAKEIVKSAWDVTKIILNPRLPIQPTLVRFRPTQTSEVGLATHANSITLTPGTISIEVARNEFLVHALTAGGAEGVQSGDMDARVTRFEART